MNEMYAVSPTACGSELELRFVLAGFGPSLGRYIGKFPGGWEALMHQSLCEFSALEQARARELLRRYKCALVAARRDYDARLDWLDNARRVQASTSPFTDVICARSQAPEFTNIDSLDWSVRPAPTGRRVPATADEYAKACSMLMQCSARVVIVDPYFRPQLTNRVRPLEALRAVAKEGRCSRIDVIARHSEVVGSGQRDEDVVLAARKRLRQDSRPSVFLHLVDDSASPHEMHMRYLVAESASIRVDKGFEEFRKQLFVDLSLVNATMHQELLRVFFDGDHGFRSLTDADGVQIA